MLVVISFALSFVCGYLPLISKLSDGTRTILLTVLIAGAAAILFPVKDTQKRRDRQVRSNVIYIIVMALVSYTIRILPLTLIRKPIKTGLSSPFYIMYRMSHLQS